MKASRKILLTTVAVCLSVGIILGVVLSENLLATRSLSSTDSRNQALTISGTETIKVLAPDGRVVSTWQGADPLTANAANGLASCITGISTGNSPAGVFGSCESWITGIAIQTDMPAGICNDGPKEQSLCSYITAAATNTLTPIGCTTGSAIAYGTCTGWITEATFGPSTFTSLNCGSKCAVENVFAGQSSGGGVWPFDQICAANYNYAGFQPLPCLSGTIATVSPQDSLLVTIQFSVSSLI